MTWSLKLATVRGIGIYVHWTFVLIIIWALVNFGAAPGATALSVTMGLALVLSLFLCVILHELGHSLTAMQFGIRTRQITLLPIGGVASLERMPEDPRQELWITAMGPMVNVVIAVVLGLVLFAVGLPTVEEPARALTTPSGFIFTLMALNVFLVIFNMVPAFPMDGGRILRAILAFWMDYPQATRIAARTGQVFAVIFGLVAFFLGQWILLIIAIFVFLGAEAETRHAALRAAFRGIFVRDAMMTRFRVLHAGDPLQQAITELLAGSQQDFPVVDDGTEGVGPQVVGMLPRDALMRALAEGGPDRAIGEFMVRDCPATVESEPIDSAFARMRERNCSAIPVLRSGQIVGLLSLENVSEMLMIRSAIEGGTPDRATMGP